MTEGPYRTADLAGCEVFTETGESLGLFKDVLPSKANDIWVVGKEPREYLIPALKSVVVSVDPPARRIVVKLPQGLREIYEA